MIKAICFDLDGVYFTSKGKKSFHEALTKEYGADPHTVDELMYRSPEMAQLVRGQITPEAFWNRVREITGITASNEELTNRWIRDYEIDENVRNVVLEGRKCGYTTCVCTNNNDIRLPALENKFHFMGDFDCILSSHEIGYTKPSKEIYEELLKRINVQPEELVYSDDNPDRLQGAQELGIQTFVYESLEQFLEELEELGVKL